MSKCAAVFLCMAFGLATTAGAANVPVVPAKKAAPTTAPAAPATPAAVKATKTDGPAARGSAPEAFANPYDTPLLLNAKPLVAGRP
jgi:hypothetical protein